MHGERAAGTDAAAHHVDSATVRLHQLMNDCESKSKSEAACVVCLRERLKYVREEVRRDALPIVHHTDFYVLTHRPNGEHHVPASWGELDGIRHQIPHHL